MKLYRNRTKNRRIPNIEPQNIKGWFRFFEFTFIGQTGRSAASGRAEP
jgi:hypothetical protein